MTGLQFPDAAHTWHISAGRHAEWRLLRIKEFRLLRDEILRVCQTGGNENAVSDATSELTWKGLAEKSDLVASALQNCGVRPGDRVGLAVPSSTNYVVALLATWTCGASFVPITTDEVADRLAHIVSDSDLQVLVAASGYSPPDGVQLIDLDEVVEQAAPRDVPSSAVRQPEDEAYVIYTSGTSGRPKGVSVSHAALHSYISSAAEIYDVRRGDRVFVSQLPVTFDAALTTLILPLTTGNRTVMTGGHHATFALAEFLSTQGERIFVKTTPSQLKVLNEFIIDEGIRAPEGTLVVGGEQLDFSDTAVFRSHGGFRIFNEYGPTEATVGCSIYEVLASDPPVGRVPIGLPHRAASFEVDRSGTDSGPGELIVSGPCVASGYVDGDQRGVFSDVEGVRSYRTGDRVQVDSDGIYHYIGRLDDQVKVQGFRVELGEVESALRRVQPLGEIAALCREGSLIAISTEPWPERATGMVPLLRTHLPYYMIPSDFRVIESVPLTPHGKIDRSALTTMV